MKKQIFSILALISLGFMSQAQTPISGTINNWTPLASEWYEIPAGQTLTLTGTSSEIRCKLTGQGRLELKGSIIRHSGENELVVRTIEANNSASVTLTTSSSSTGPNLPTCEILTTNLGSNSLFFTVNRNVIVTKEVRTTSGTLRSNNGSKLQLRNAGFSKVFGVVSPTLQIDFMYQYPNVAKYENISIPNITGASCNWPQGANPVSNPADRNTLYWDEVNGEFDYAGTGAPGTGVNAYLGNITSGTNGIVTANGTGGVGTGKSWTLTSTPSTYPTTDCPTATCSEGWNLVGNPFRAFIDWGNPLGYSRSSVTSFAAWAGTKYVYANGAGTAYDPEWTTPGIIEPTQGFYLKTNTNGSTFTINSDAISSFGTNSAFKGATAFPSSTNKWVSVSLNGTTVYLYHEDNAGDGAEVYDAESRPGEMVTLGQMTHLAGDNLYRFSLADLVNDGYEVAYDPVYETHTWRVPIYSKGGTIITRPTFAIQGNAFGSEYTLEFEGMQGNKVTLNNNGVSYVNGAIGAGNIQRGYLVLTRTYIYPSQPGGPGGLPGQNGQTASRGSDQVANLRIFPNPANDFLNIEGASSALILNMAGQIVKQGIGRLAINDLTSGVYLVRCTMPDGKEVTQKFVKQ
jgi:hypothetical protein